MGQGRTAHDVAAYISSTPSMVGSVSVLGGKQPPRQKPTKSWVAPALIGATAVGVGAAALIFTQPNLTASMMAGTRGGLNPNELLDFNNISLPEGLTNVDLTPPAEAAETFGEFAGNAVEAGGAFIGNAGEFGGRLLSSAQAAAAGVDLSGASAFASNAADGVGNAATGAGAALAPVAQDAGGAVNSGLDSAGDGAEDCCDCCAGCLGGE